MMVIRTYALYERSKAILVILLVFAGSSAFATIVSLPRTYRTSYMREGALTFIYDSGMQRRREAY